MELWKTDGTAEGTTQVADVNPTGSSVPANLRNVNGRLFFTADDGVHGEELWRSDGTAAGTALVADLNPAGGSYPHYVVNADGTLFFAADDGSGTQLWTLHGCGSATESCAIVRLPLPDRPPSSSAVPYLVKDLNPGPGDGTPYDMTDVGGTAFFQAYRPDTGVELWASDGTEAGTRLVRDLNPGPDGSSPYDFTDLGGVAFFVASTTGDGVAVWKSDGTERGTELVQAFASTWQGSAPHDLTVAGGKVWFVAPGEGGNDQIWSTDGGAAHLLPTPFPGWPPYSAGTLAALGDTLFFTVYDFELGKQALWKTDGTPAGTSRLRGFRGFARPRFTSAGSLLFFRANSNELWRTDGTVAGTVMLMGSGDPDEFTALGDLLFFAASDFDHGRELWRSDGTPLGTWRVKDIDPGPADGMPGRLTNVDGTLFFWAADGVTGFELWKSDGTPRRHGLGARHRSHRRHRAVVLPGGRRPPLLHRTDPELRLRAVAQRRQSGRDRPRARHQPHAQQLPRVTGQRRRCPLLQRRRRSPGRGAVGGARREHHDDEHRLDDHRDQ